ncbi:MAG: hypothetical protein IJP92_00685 [Lachnospiraceae bacterium]|nr:hypothetical protein [Lachnospiraceae bacterium]
MRRDESPIVDKDAEQVWNKAIDEVIEIIEKEIESCEARYQLGEFMPDVCALLRVGTVVKGMKGGEWG